MHGHGQPAPDVPTPVLYCGLARSCPCLGRRPLALSLLCFARRKQVHFIKTASVPVVIFSLFPDPHRTTPRHPHTFRRRPHLPSPQLRAHHILGAVVKHHDLRRGPSRAISRVGFVAHLSLIGLVYETKRSLAASPQPPPRPIHSLHPPLFSSQRNLPLDDSIFKHHHRHFRRSTVLGRGRIRLPLSRPIHSLPSLPFDRRDAACCPLAPRIQHAQRSCQTRNSSSAELCETLDT